MIGSLQNVMDPELGLGTEFRSEKIPRNRLGTEESAHSKALKGKEFRVKNEVLRNLHSLSDHSDGIYILL
jgi:hypothetical protein